MRIRRIEIKNYRSIRELVLDLPEKDNRFVLFGPNGCGKTSVIEACLQALGLASDRKVPVDQDYFIKLDVVTGAGSYEIVKTRDKHVYRDVQSFVDDPQSFMLKGKRATAFPTFSSMLFSSWRAPVLKDHVDLSVGKGRRPDKTDENALLRLQQYCVNMLGLANLTHDHAAQEFKLGCLSDAWRVFYPGSRVQFRAEPVDRGGGGYDDVDVGKGFNLYLKSPDGTRIPVNDLSSGEIEMLCLFGSLIIEKGSFDVVFIDEPELHLNPIWHRVVVPTLSRFSPHTQFVVATHSLDIWDSVLSNERHTMEEVTNA